MTGILIHGIDITLWLIMAGSVAYILFFAIVSLLPAKADKASEGMASETLSPHTFLVMFPAYAEDTVIVSSVKSFLRQDYPADKYHIAVISDHMSDETNKALAALPVTLHTPSFDKSTKAKAMQYAMEHCNRTYDYVLILDADNVAAPNFLSLLSQACTPGTHAVQCHRCAKNTENAIAMLDAVSEEINNTIFRQAHRRLLLPSALIGSGMCIDFKWFKDNVTRLRTAGEDRELEMMLISSRRHIKYEKDILVYDEKVSNRNSFKHQRQRWMSAQLNSLCAILPELPAAIRTGNVGVLDKALQYMLIPRSILIAAVTFMSLLTTILSPQYSIKWWILLAGLAFALCSAIPSHMRTRAVFASLTALPAMAWSMITNVIRIKKANTDFIHTSHNK